MDNTGCLISGCLHFIYLFNKRLIFFKKKLLYIIYVLISEDIKSKQNYDIETNKNNWNRLKDRYQ